MSEARDHPDFWRGLHIGPCYVGGEEAAIDASLNAYHELTKEHYGMQQQAAFGTAKLAGSNDVSSDELGRLAVEIQTTLDDEVRLTNAMMASCAEALDPIIAEHEAAITPLRVRRGQLLLAARQLVPKGEWEAWCKLTIGPFQTQRDIRACMALARSADPIAAAETEKAKTRERVQKHRAKASGVTAGETPVTPPTEPWEESTKGLPAGTPARARNIDPTIGVDSNTPPIAPTLATVQDAVRNLSTDDFAEFKRWFHGFSGGSAITEPVEPRTTDTKSAKVQPEPSTGNIAPTVTAAAPQCRRPDGDCRYGACKARGLCLGDAGKPKPAMVA
jgi:hypothetical protein